MILLEVSFTNNNRKAFNVISMKYMILREEKKIVTLSFALLLLTIFMISPVQARPLRKEVTTEIIDGPFPPDSPNPNVYGKGVMHRTLIIKSVNEYEGTISVIMLTTVEVRLYQLIPSDGSFQAGELLLLLKMTQMYEGTIVPGIPGGGMVTGTMVMDWVINVLGGVNPFPPNTDLRGHWVTLFENGVEVKKIGFGVFPLQ